jgi:hypothetical protein
MIMNFQDAAARFEHSGAGTDDFKRLYKDAFELMSSDAENAGLYFVIGVAAHSYVTLYEDQGVSGDFSDQAKAVLVGFNTRILRALGADPATRLRLLGEVATEYQLRVHEF